MNRRQTLAAAILVWIGGLGLSVRAAHAQEDVHLAASEEYVGHPADTEKRLEYARILLDRGSEREAVEQFEAVLELGPERLDLRRALADLYFELDRPAEGVHHLERILEARPGDLDLRRELARHYVWTDALEKAADQYRIVLEQSREDSQALEGLGAVLIDLGRGADAAVYLERLVAVDSTDLSARLRLAQALAWSDQPDRALHQLDVILARRPNDPEALFLAGELRRWEAVGWFRGKEHLDLLLYQEPGHPRARRLLKELRAERGPVLAPSVYRSSDSNQLATTRLSLEIATWMAGDWRVGLHWDRSTLTDRRERDPTHRSIHGLSTEIVRSFSQGGTLRGRLGFNGSPRSWTPITGQLEYQGRVSRTVSASVSTALRPVLGSPLSIDRQILERRLAAEGNVHPSERLEIWGAASYSSFTDRNRGVMGAVGGQVNARLAAPFVALYGRYTYEDTEIVYSESRPYWTPQNLSTLDAGIELAGSPVSWAELGLRLGLSEQDRVSYTYDVGIRSTPGDYHSVDIRFGRWGSDVYSSTSLSLQYSHRLDFPWP